MTQEEKLQEAKRLYKTANSDQRYVLESLFPELKESEDERIRKSLLRWMRSNSYTSIAGMPIKNVIAWLEKQGEQKNKINSCKFTCEDILALECSMKTAKITKGGDELYKILVPLYNKIHNAYLDELQGEQKLVDKVEPKFKVGDWIVYNRDDCSREIIQVYDVRDGRYYFTDNVHFSWSVKECDEKSHLWTIQDAKDGDVLVYKDEISLYKHDINNCTNQETTFGGFVFHCCYDGKRFIMDSLYSLTEQDKMDIQPATKEQRDLLFQKMKEEGYVWDAEKKELSSVKLKAGKVLKQDNLSVLCLGGRNAVKCNGEPFVIQYPDEWIEVYGEEYDKFFTRLQSSGYYYDFLHNQVKENCNTLWVARDFDGALAVFTNKPVLTKSKNRWIDLTDKNDFFSILPEYYYPKVTFENSPLQLFHL